MQRVYMASGPLQARRVFNYATLFSMIIALMIVLIGLCTAIAAPQLPVAGIWSYILAHIPNIFKGLLAVSLVALAMSTEDSKQHSCSVLISHDLLAILKGKKNHHGYKPA